MILRVHADFGQRVILRPEDRKWVPSPLQGVDRQLLDRIGGEVARATSIVRYAPGSHFSAHVHEGGEEFLVLEGEFADEHGRYPAGSYVRNPIGSRHAPFSETGCILFVKLRQFAEEDAAHVVVDTRTSAFRPGLVPGLSVLPLHTFGGESVALVRWQPGTRFQPHRHWGGEEILVVEGVFEDEHGRYPQGSWLRSPDGSVHNPFSTEGCLIWVKTGHLLEVPSEVTSAPPPSGV